MSSIEEEARRLGHPDPEKATPGEINVLSIASLSAGRLPSSNEACRYLEMWEKESDFNDLFRD